MLFFNRRWILGGLLLLTGCDVSLPHHQQVENLISQPSLEKSRKSALESSFFAKGDWPEDTWWEIFNSGELNTLMETALAQNYSLQEVAQKIEFANQEAVIVRSRLLPLIFLNGDDTYQYLSKNGLYRAFNPKIPLSANLIDLNLSFSYEFDFWGKYRNLFYASLGELQVREAETREVELVVTTALAAAYFNLKIHLLKKRLFDRLYEVRQGVSQLEDLLREKALLSKLPPLSSLENTAEAQKLVLTIDDEIAIDRHLINVLIGRGADEPIDVEGSLAPLPAKISIPDTLSIDLIARRPDLMAQIWRVKALAFRVGAAIAEFLPNVNLKAFIGLESLSYKRLLQGNSMTAGVEPAFHLPIFTAGAIRANVRGTKALFNEALFEYNNLILRSVQDVADQLVLTRSIFLQKEQQESIVKSARRRYELSMLRKEKGLANLLETYAIEVELIQKELEDLTLLANQYLSFVKLIKAMGGGFHADFVPLTPERACE